jgi:hypothetical protein
VELGWQDLVAIGIVCLAVLYLARLAWGALARKQSAGCGAACGHCSAGSEKGLAAPPQVVSIGVPPGAPAITPSPRSVVATHLSPR